MYSIANKKKPSTLCIKGILLRCLTMPTLIQGALFANQYHFLAKSVTPHFYAIWLVRICPVINLKSSVPYLESNYSQVYALGIREVSHRFSFLLKS